MRFSAMPSKMEARGAFPNMDQGYNRSMSGSSPIDSPPARRRASVGVVVLLAVIAFLDRAQVASGEPEHPFPIPMRVEGYVGTKPEGVTSLARWVVAIDGVQYTFHVIKLVPLGVDIAYWTILNKLEPLPVTLTLYGDPQLLREFIDAPAGMAIALTGNFEFGPGPATLMLSSVDPLPAPTPGAAAATPSPHTSAAPSTE